MCFESFQWPSADFFLWPSANIDALFQISPRNGILQSLNLTVKNFEDQAQAYACADKMVADQRAAVLAETGEDLESEHPNILVEGFPAADTFWWITYGSTLVCFRYLPMQNMMLVLPQCLCIAGSVTTIKNTKQKECNMDLELTQKQLEALKDSGHMDADLGVLMPGTGSAAVQEVSSLKSELKQFLQKLKTV